MLARVKAAEGLEQDEWDHCQQSEPCVGQDLGPLRREPDPTTNWDRTTPTMSNPRLITSALVTISGVQSRRLLCSHEVESDTPMDTIVFMARTQVTTALYSPRPSTPSVRSVSQPMPSDAVIPRTDDTTINNIEEATDLSRSLSIGLLAVGSGT